MPDLDIFTPISSNRLSDEAVLQIKTLIEQGDLKPGDKLPSERELVKRLSVSRPSIREALRSLEAMGLVHVQPGLGAFITEHSIDTLTVRWHAWLLEHKQEVVKLLEVRQALEPSAAALATERITVEELKELDSNLLAMQKSGREGNTDLAVKTDIEFHDLLSQATRNSFLVELCDSINYALIESRYAYFQDQERILTSWRQHSQIVEAIRKGDPEAAKSSLLEHVLHSKQLIQDFGEEF